MSSIIKPIEVFEEGIQDAIERKTGKRPNIEELRVLNSKEIGKLAGINKMIIRIIPGLLSEIVCLKEAAYNRAVVSHLLTKKDYF